MTSQVRSCVCLRSRPKRVVGSVGREVGEAHSLRRDCRVSDTVTTGYLFLMVCEVWWLSKIAMPVTLSPLFLLSHGARCGGNRLTAMSR
jgi:hypothetical protein